jgi:hypothetical protein
VVVLNKQLWTPVGNSPPCWRLGRRLKTSVIQEDLKGRKVA